MFNITCRPIITVADFRSNFTEFSSTSAFPDSTINYWIVIATLLLRPERWLTLLPVGISLFVAHEVTLEAQAQDAAAAGGWPGISKGAISSEGAGQVNVSYASEPTLEDAGGNYNLTTYGTRFLRLARMAGMGGLQIGPGCGVAGVVPGSGNGSAGAWSGPPVKPGWLGS